MSLATVRSLQVLMGLSTSVFLTAVACKSDKEAETAGYQPGQVQYPPGAGAAGTAIRLMRHPEVDGIIAERLTHDDHDAQLAALDALSVREPSDALARALGRAAGTASKPATRLRAVRIMSLWLPRRPDLRTALEGLAANDEHERVRNAAKAALGS